MTRVCAHCHQVIKNNHYHVSNGEIVCADDRLCYPKPINSKNRKLAIIKSRYAD